MTEQVLAHLEDGVQVLTLNRPEKKNALTAEMYRVLADRIASADRDANVAVIMITAAGSAFTTGSDMSLFAQANAAPAAPDPTENDGARFIRNLAAAEKPVVAAVNGMAVGIGVTALLHCDLVYAAASATFQMPFVNLGLVPEAGSSLLLPRLVGQQKAADLLLNGARISAQKAEALGLVAEIFADETLADEALARARALAARAPNAVRLTKALLRAGERAAVAAQIAEEDAHFYAQMRSAEVKEAVSAFFEKRPADFSKLS